MIYSPPTYQGESVVYRGGQSYQENSRARHPGVFSILSRIREIVI